MKLTRAYLGFSALVLATFVVACGGGYGPTTTSSPVVVATATGAVAFTGTTYIALGDDATAGIGSLGCGTVFPSVNCPSNSTTAGSALKTAGGVAINGYSQLLTTQINNLHSAQPFFFIPLGVTGALAGSEPVPASSQNDIVTNASQLSQIPGAVSSARARTNRVAISVFAGINDVVDAYFTQQCGAATTGAGATIANPCGASGTTLPATTALPRVGSLYNGYLNLFRAVAANAPDAVLVIGVPDVSKFPVFVSALLPLQLSQLSTDSGLANAALQAAVADSGLRFAFTDLVAAAVISPGSFTGPSAFSSDHFHYIDAGYAAIESAAFASFTAAFPTF